MRAARCRWYVEGVVLSVTAASRACDGLYYSISAPLMNKPFGSWPWDQGISQQCEPV